MVSRPAGRRPDRLRTRRRQPARDQRCRGECHRDDRVCDRVERVDPVQERPQRGGRRKCADKTDRDPDGRQGHPASNDHTLHTATRRAQREAYTDLLHALADQIRDHTVDADRAEQQCDRGGNAQHDLERCGLAAGFGEQL